MAVQLNVDGDVKRAISKLSLSKERIQKAAAQALNRTAQQVRTAAVKEIAKQEGIKQADVRKYVTLRTRANRRSLRAAVNASGAAPNLIEWVKSSDRNPMRFRKDKGVTAKVMGSIKEYERTFIVKAKNGKMIVVKRSNTAKRVKNKWQPNWSKGIYGPPPKREFAQAVIMQAMKRVAKERWPINWKQAINFALSEGAGS